MTVNARDTTGNALVVALVGAENTATPHPAVSVNAVQTEDGGDLKQTMNQGFKQLSSNLQSKFDKLDTRLAGVEKWQADQIQYFKDRAAKQRAEREKRNKEWKDKKDNAITATKRRTLVATRAVRPRRRKSTHAPACLLMLND